jgi:hypothetical protein
VRITALCALGAAALLPAPANADFEIYSPAVEEGVLELKLFGTRSFDPKHDKNSEQTRKFEFSYGVNSWWQTAIETKVKKEPRGGFLYDATSWEMFFRSPCRENTGSISACSLNTSTLSGTPTRTKLN